MKPDPDEAEIQRNRSPRADAQKEVSMNENTKLTARQAAEYVGCSYSGLVGFVRRGEMAGTYYRVGSKLIFSQSGLDDWMKRGGSASERSGN